MAQPDDTPAPGAETAAPQPALTLGQMMFGHFVLLIACVGLPVIFTATSPLTVVHLTRENRMVTAHVSKRLLFVIPYRNETVEDVTSIGSEAVTGTDSRSRTPSGGTRTVQTEDSAYLVIEGATRSAKVEVSPVNIESVLKKTGAFAADYSDPELRFITIANWKFGVFAGGLLSVLTIFYLWLQTASLVRRLRRLVRRGYSPAAA